jgi:hypothetical protein
MTPTHVHRMPLSVAATGGARQQLVERKGAVHSAES